MERLSGRPVVFSHRDWDLARRWHDQGVPLGMVLELLEERGERAARGLRSIASGVESSWQVVCAGEVRIGSRSAAPPEPESTPADPYAAAAARTDVLELARLLHIASTRSREGDDRAAIDLDLDRELAQACPAAWLEEAARDIATRLAPYRGRLPPTELDRVRARARRDALRARVGLPPTAVVPRDDLVG
jgi:hypothetical protein